MTLASIPLVTILPENARASVAVLLRRQRLRVCSTSRVCTFSAIRCLTGGWAGDLVTIAAWMAIYIRPLKLFAAQRRNRTLPIAEQQVCCS